MFVHFKSLSIDNKTSARYLSQALAPLPRVHFSST